MLVLNYQPVCLQVTIPSDFRISTTYICNVRRSWIRFLPYIDNRGHEPIIVALPASQVPFVEHGEVTQGETHTSTILHAFVAQRSFVPWLYDKIAP